MAERFEKLFDLPSNLYVEGSPLVISAGVLLKDTQTGKIITQIKFQNISGNTIKAVKISLDAFDVSGEVISGVEEYQYLDLSVCNGAYFGSDKAIIMPNSNCRSIGIGEIVIIFSDNSLWSGNGKNYFSLQMPKKLQSDMGAELIKQYRIATTAEAVYAPLKQSDYWICTCGTMNKGSSCTKCHCAKDKVFSSYDMTILTHSMNIRLENERIERERIANEKEETEKQEQLRKAKTKKVLSITIPSITAIIIFVIVLTSVIIPNAQYNDAISLMNEEKYKEAEDAFWALNGYKDSATKIKECQYLSAVAAQSSKRYETAYEIFVSLGKYSDSESKAKSCAQEAGDTAFSKKQYQTAIDWYSKIKLYNEVNKVKYQYVLDHKNNDDTTTSSYLSDLKKANYKDSSSIYSELYDWKIEIIAINSDPESTKNATSISKYDPVYIHFRLTGGLPNARIEPYVKFTLPNGNTGTHTWDYYCHEGDTLWFGWADGIYNTPANGTEGVLIVNFYRNTYTNEIIGSATIKITK